MECMGATVGELELDDFVGAISTVYSSHDRKRSIWDIWCHAFHHAAAIAEEVRKDALPPAPFSKMRQEIADVTLWLLTAISKLQRAEELSEAGELPQDAVVQISVPMGRLMLNRYPGICPWCKSALPDACRCIAMEIPRRKKVKEIERQRALETRRIAASSLSAMPRTIDHWQEMLAKIYRPTLEKSTVAEIALHLLEEMGEVSDALIRMYSYGNSISADEPRARQMRLEDELADTASVLFELVERLPLDKNESSLTLSALVWEEYGSNDMKSFYCRHCKEKVCQCAITLVQSTELISDTLEKLKNPELGKHFL
jgi:NTP pyrophosphatase (non-canonical NTP hydrolase)